MFQARGTVWAGNLILPTLRTFTASLRQLPAASIDNPAVAAAPSLRSFARVGFENAEEKVLARPLIRALSENSEAWVPLDHLERYSRFERRRILVEFEALRAQTGAKIEPQILAAAQINNTDAEALKVLGKNARLLARLGDMYGNASFFEASRNMRELSASQFDGAMLAAGPRGGNSNGNGGSGSSGGGNGPKPFDDANEATDADLKALEQELQAKGFGVSAVRKGPTGISIVFSKHDQPAWDNTIAYLRPHPRYKKLIAQGQIALTVAGSLFDL